MRSFFDAAPEISKNVPMLIGSVSEEGNRMSSRPTEEEWHANLAKTYGEEKATAIIAASEESLPEKEDTDSVLHMFRQPGLNGLSMRNNVVKMAKLKHDFHAAPAYAYYFTWQTPMLDGLPGAWHTAELQFCFDNTKRCEQGTGNTPEAQILAKKMASSWAAFAATGKPSIPGIPWEPSDPETNKTMLWDNDCRMVNDPDGEARQIISGLIMLISLVILFIGLAIKLNRKPLIMVGLSVKFCRCSIRRTSNHHLCFPGSSSRTGSASSRTKFTALSG